MRSHLKISAISRASDGLLQGVYIESDTSSEMRKGFENGDWFFLPHSAPARCSVSQKELITKWEQEGLISCDCETGDKIVQIKAGVLQIVSSFILGALFGLFLLWLVMS